MKSKLMTFVFVITLCLAAAPLAIEQLSNLQYVAEKWTRATFLSGIVTAHASEKEAGATPAPAAAPLASRSAASADEFRWSGRIPAGRIIEIKGINGDIRAEASNSNEVEVTAIKSARRSDPKEVEIRVVEHGNGVTICAVYPSANASRPNQCAPEDGGSMNIRDNDVEVEFSVRVPQGVRFSGRTVNGGIETGALASDVDAKTVNGSISVSSSGVARAKTVNGSIVATLGRADWNGALEFKTVNGAITLNLPSDMSAELKAETLNGDISSDFPVSVMGRRGRTELTGTIGGGGRELSLKTVNGSIRLRRAS
jgi:Putative adhesin